MITFPEFIHWNIRSITTYRFLEQNFVNQFFEEGKIRLSSFKKFRGHQDNIRGDNYEGSAFYVANYESDNGTGHNFSTWVNAGKNAYLLCTSLLRNNVSFTNCNYDSGFKINDVAGFALEIGRAIPFFLGGMIGQCIYREPPTIPIYLGKFNLSDLSEGELALKQQEFFEKTNQDNDIFFVKSSTYESQEEYRIIWFADSTEDHIDLVCPKAIELCERL